MAKTFTNIRKWAEQNGYKVEDRHGYGGKPRIFVTVNEQLSFDVEERDSTIYHSIKGMRGHAKGTYMDIIHNGRGGYACCYASQKDIIRRIEMEMERMMKLAQ